LGSAPDHAGGAYSAPPDPWIDLREGRGKRRKGEARKRDERGKGRNDLP